MTPPIQVPNKTATSSTLPESPEVQAAREQYRQAGFERNRAEQTHKQAVKDYGADSPEAKAAKSELDKAQAGVEAKGKELSKALNLKPQAAPKPPSKEPPKKEPVLEAIKSFESSHLVREYRSETIILRTHPILNERAFKDRLEKILKELKKDPKILEHLEQLHTPHGEESFKIFESERQLTKPNS